MNRSILVPLPAQKKLTTCSWSWKASDGIDPTEVLREAKRMGFSDGRLAGNLASGRQRRQEQVRHFRKKHGLKPVYKRVDTCAAEFEVIRLIFTRLTKMKTKLRRQLRSKVVILGSGPKTHRAGN